MIDIFQKLVLDPIMHAVIAFASRDAFCINGIKYTYRQLGETIEALRNGFRERSEQICTLEIHDNLTTYASILALWLEGKAYVPLNPHHPKERNRSISEQPKGSESGCERCNGFSAYVADGNAGVDDE